MVRHDLLPGRYEALAYSSKGKFNVELTLRDHSPYHAGVVSNTYYVEYFSFEVESEKVTVIQGYIRPYRTKDLHEKDREDSGWLYCLLGTQDTDHREKSHQHAKVSMRDNDDPFVTVWCC